MAHNKKDLIEGVIRFKEKHDRYPTPKDWRDKLMTPDRNVYKRHFGKPEKIIQIAEAFERGDVSFDSNTSQLKTRAKAESKDTKGSGAFPCPYCGSTTPVDGYHSTLKTIQTNRLIKRLKEANNDACRVMTIIDCMVDICGPQNEILRPELALLGYLETFEGKFMEKYGAADLGKERCYKCGNYYDDHELTIDCISPYRTEYICDNCVSTKGEVGEPHNETFAEDNQ